MTKAATIGEKRRRKAARAPETAACQISGVRVSASKEARHRAAQGDAEACRKSALRWCCIMGWPPTDERIASARDQRIATLYGRLAILGRISEDAYLAMREYEAVDLRYRREVLGTAHHVEDYASRTVMDAEELRDHIRQITEHFMGAQAVIDAWSGPIREQFHRALATDDTPPAYVSDAQAKCVEVVAHALARHFKIRT